MNLTTLGIDLAKTSFSLVGMDERGKVILRKTLKRDSLLPFIAQCPQCLIGMEACSGAHYWAREFRKLGHEVGIMVATKQGDSYLRMCLVHGARSVIANLKNKQDKVSCWIRQLVESRGYLRAIVALQHAMHG